MDGRRTFFRGLVVSDLHLFARRSIGAECFDGVRSQLGSVDVLVLNGDIFDFRWSTLPNAKATTEAAARWLRDLLLEFPNCETHYVLGNHDCSAVFAAELAALACSFRQLRAHRYGVRIGTACFVHGDCAHRRMDAAALRDYRADWDNERQLSRARANAYVAIDRTGITRLAHRMWFPRRATIRRVIHYLGQAAAGWRTDTRHCYFGHTHLPFSDHDEDGILFHNTGSAIRGMGFNPRMFSVNGDAIVSLN